MPDGIMSLQEWRKGGLGHDFVCRPQYGEPGPGRDGVLPRTQWALDVIIGRGILRACTEIGARSFQRIAKMGYLGGDWRTCASSWMPTWYRRCGDSPPLRFSAARVFHGHPGSHGGSGNLRVSMRCIPVHGSIWRRTHPPGVPWKRRQ